MKVEFSADKNYGLIGYPLGHSMSAIIHAQLFKLKNIKATYRLIEVEPEKLEEEFKSDLKRLNGFNVTIPHKINIIPFCDELSLRAKLFGSVNTVDVREDKIKGYNTDCSGFLRALEMAGIKLQGKVLLCGAGGVSRMFAFESILAECELTIAVREADLEAANVIKSEIKQKLNAECNVILLSEAEGGYDLIINGTPVGMYPKVDACPLDESVIKSSKAVFDAVYNPEETLFVKYAREAGLKYSNGLPMLVWQAAVAQEIWLGVKFRREDIEEIIEITRRELNK